MISSTIIIIILFLHPPKRQNLSFLTEGLSPTTTPSLSPLSSMTRQQLSWTIPPQTSSSLKEAIEAARKNIYEITDDEWLQPQKMNYGIFNGRSILRDDAINRNEQLMNLLKSLLVEDDEDDDGLSHEMNNDNNRITTTTNNENNDVDAMISTNKNESRRALASLLILCLRPNKNNKKNNNNCHHYLDLAHEILLGVSPRNIPSAEYAATHRGQTSWAKDHPLNDVGRYVHALIHRGEGGCVGEGGVTGFENAKYWFGSLLLPSSSSSRATCCCRCYGLVSENLTRLAGMMVPHRCCNDRLIADATTVHDGHDDEGMTAGYIPHDIIAGDGHGGIRTIYVPSGHWDSFSFCDLLLRHEKEGGEMMDGGEQHPDRQRSVEREKEMACLIRMELELLLKVALDDVLSS